mmetsp:Transcript_83128/g.164941  ORF Transcript_83128/g.164941 Transcript_83128/m.164941 type:complete len:253 (-) Transcript_83128:45-803(-)
MPTEVHLAVSPLGGVPGATAYHSSILVDGQEFSFGQLGIAVAAGLASHTPVGGSPRVINQGFSIREGRHLGRQLIAVLGRHFEQGTYDLLRKNCNTFTDCALFFLVGQRLDEEYKSLERVGARMPSLLQTVSRGGYVPNPRVAAFDLEAVIRTLDANKASRDADRAAGLATAEVCVLCGMSSWMPRFLKPQTDDAKLLQEDIALAQALQAEEEDLLADEQLARALQAEEDATRIQPQRRSASSHRGRIFNFE